MTNLDCYSNLSMEADLALDAYLYFIKGLHQSAMMLNQARANWENSEARIGRFKEYIREVGASYSEESTFEDC